MRWIAAATFGGLALLAGCLGAKSTQCPGGWTCPDNYSCVSAAPYCGPTEEVKRCTGKQNFDACKFLDTSAGACFGEVCEECSPNLAASNCTYPGMWKAMTLPPQASGVNLHAIWVAGYRDAYAGGDAGTLLHYDGESWSIPMTFPTLSEQVKSIWGSNANNVFVLASTRVFHFDGNSWQEVTPPPQAPLPFVPLLALGGDGSDQVLAVGFAGTILQYAGTPADRTKWLTVSAPAVDLYGIWGSGASNLFAVAYAGVKKVIERYNGSTWTQSTPTSPDLMAVWGSGPNSVYAVGAVGMMGFTIFEFDGASWTPMSAPPSAVNLSGIWGSGSGAFSVGDRGVVLQLAGTSWSSMVTPDATTRLEGVAGSSEVDVFAVGVGGAIWHYTGG